MLWACNACCLGSYETACAWLHELRHAMVRPGRDPLHGLVEVDETYVGGEQPGKRGRGAAGKSLVLVAAEEDGARIGRIRLLRVPDTSGASLCGTVSECVEPGSVVHTDGLSSYGGLSALGYRHELTRQSSAPVGEDPLPRVHRLALLSKAAHGRPDDRHLRQSIHRGSQSMSLAIFFSVITAPHDQCRVTPDEFCRAILAQAFIGLVGYHSTRLLGASVTRG